jgi:hypothetical protein
LRSAALPSYRRSSDAVNPRLLPIVAVTLATLTGASGCVSLPDKLKTISAGHTGCEPEQLVISAIRNEPTGTLWNATCNGKTYLCSAVQNGKSSDEYSCALKQP